MVHSALQTESVSEPRRMLYGGRRREKRGDFADRRDKKPMHVLLPAVRRLQSDDRFHGARLTKSDVEPGLSVGLVLNPVRQE